MAIDLFTPVVPEDRLNPLFTAVAHRTQEPARRLLEEVAATFNDRDGNFVKDFQTTGFDGRLWELYLHAYLLADGFTLDEKRAVPDYIATKAARTVFIEAVTVNQTQAKAADEAEAAAGGLAGWDLFFHRMQNVYPIKFGSPLFSKMKKKYWEQEHVRGQPFILAIEDFHEPGSMVWTGPALELYLYGFNYWWRREAGGELSVWSTPIGKHKDGAKEIPSGFFDSPDSEHVSAVLFSNSATVPKFNRMGYQRGHRPDDVVMLRLGARYDHTPHASEPCPFMYIVGEPSAPEESWAQGLSMFHNPKARVPVPEEMFPGIAHHWLDEQNRMRSSVPAFHPFGSVTQILNGVPDGTALPSPSLAFTQLLRGQPPVGGVDAAGTAGVPPGVRRISQAEFESHGLARGPMLAPATEKAWFASEKGLIGTILLDHADKDWNYVVMGPDASGRYRWVAGGGGMDTQEETEQALAADMASR